MYSDERALFAASVAMGWLLVRHPELRDDPQNVDDWIQYIPEFLAAFFLAPVVGGFLTIVATSWGLASAQVEHGLEDEWL